MTLVLAERPRGAGWYDGGNRPFFPSRPLRTTQRRLAIAIALTAAAALGLTALALRDGIARQVHLLRLRDDPSLFEGMLSSGSAPREAACRDFVNEPAGKEALFRLYLVEYGRASTLKDEPRAPKGKPVFIAEMLTAPFDRAAITLTTSAAMSGRPARTADSTKSWAEVIATNGCPPPGAADQIDSKRSSASAGRPRPRSSRPSALDASPMDRPSRRGTASARASSAYVLHSCSRPWRAVAVASAASRLHAGASWPMSRASCSPSEAWVIARVT